MMPVATRHGAVLSALVQLVGCRKSVRPSCWQRPSVTDRASWIVGSGRAVVMLEAGGADVVISNAPEREAKVISEHPTWFYSKILYNDFLIGGPSTDPVRIAGLTDAVRAIENAVAP